MADKRLAIAYRAQEKLRLYHNRVGGCVAQASDGFVSWRAEGYPLGDIPAMSIEQFRIWQAEWFDPRNARLSATIGPLKDAWVTKEAARRGVSTLAVDLGGMKRALKDSADNDGEIDLMAV